MNRRLRINKKHRLPAAAAAMLVMLGIKAEPVLGGETVTLVLKNRAEVTAPLVRVGDIVEGGGKTGLAALKIFPSPGWGQSREKSRAEVLGRLLQMTSARIRLTGSDTITLVRPGGDRSREIRAKVEAAVEERSTQTEGLSCELLFPDKPVPLPWGDMEITCSFPEKLVGKRILRCQVIVGGNIVKSSSYTCRFLQSKNVPVATRKLMRGDTLKAGDVTWEEKTFDSVIPPVIAEDETLPRYRVTRTVPENEIVTLGHVEPHPAVRTGQLVDLIIQKFSVRVTTRAVALQTGWVGSRIRLRNPMNNSYVHGIITSEGVVVHE